MTRKAKPSGLKFDLPKDRTTPPSSNRVSGDLFYRDLSGNVHNVGRIDNYIPTPDIQVNPEEYSLWFCPDENN